MSSKNFRELKKCDKNPVREQVQVMYWKFEKKQSSEKPRRGVKPKSSEQEHGISQ